MTARLAYSSSTALGKQLAQSTNQLLKVTADLFRLREAMYMSMYGTPPDWAFFASEIGCSEADAQGIFTLVDGAKTILDVQGIKDLSKVDQG